MSLTKQTINDKIEVINLDVGYPTIQVRTAIIVKEDGVELSRKLHRKTLLPTDDISGEDPDVLSIAQAVFTDEVKQKYAEYRKAQQISE